MSTLWDRLKRQSDVRPPRVLLYGTGGIGKTTFAAHAPNPVFLQTEESEVGAATFGLLRSYDEVMAALHDLYEQPHDFGTLVLDSLDWLEPLIWQATAVQNGWANIETPGYGKGYLAASEQWRALLEGTTALRDDRGMAIVLIAHHEIKRFESPETDPYDRYQPKLQARAAALVQEHVDAVLFANYHVATVRTDLGFNKKATRGVSSGDRLAYTTERPAWLAKNRYGMPDSIPLSWAEFEKFVPYYSASTTQPTTTEE
jgi:hypothetical protein